MESGLMTPEARPQYISIPPSEEHFAYYDLVMERFAQIWKERLKRELETGHVENSAYILPELDALAFASTVPIHDHSMKLPIKRLCG